MRISVYTRHNIDCKYQADTSYRRCKCPKWHYCAEWPKTQRSAKTRSWDEAESRAREMEQGEQSAKESSVADAVKSYLENIEARGLSKNYSLKLKRELEELKAWTETERISKIRKLTLLHLEKFRSDWKGAPGTRARRQERLRGFFLYCKKHAWVTDNYAKYLSPIKVKQEPTQPFSHKQWAAILKAATEERVRVFLELLRWSGLRMGDAARLDKEKVQGGKLLLYMAKTGHPVYVPLPPRLVADLESIHFPAARWEYDNWHKKLKEVFKTAKMPTAHPHQIRDTFAVELLLAGVPLDQVSILLGHTTIKTTEKHYSPWVKARQDQLEASVAKSWT
jgi:site-specific recombinase XerD